MQRGTRHTIWLLCSRKQKNNLFSKYPIISLIIILPRSQPVTPLVITLITHITNYNLIISADWLIELCVSLKLLKRAEKCTYAFVILESSSTAILSHYRITRQRQTPTNLLAFESTDRKKTNKNRQISKARDDTRQTIIDVWFRSALCRRCRRRRRRRHRRLRLHYFDI